MRRRSGQYLAEAHMLGNAADINEFRYPCADIMKLSRHPSYIAKKVHRVYSEASEKVCAHEIWATTRECT